MGANEVFGYKWNTSRLMDRRKCIPDAVKLLRNHAVHTCHHEARPRRGDVSHTLDLSRVMKRLCRAGVPHEDIRTRDAVLVKNVVKGTLVTPPNRQEYHVPREMIIFVPHLPVNAIPQFLEPTDRFKVKVVGLCVPASLACQDVRHEV